MISNEIDSPEILMSPLLSDKFDKINNDIKNLNKKCDKIFNFLEENRQIYLEMLKMINNASSENNKILNENKKLYKEAIKKIEDSKTEYDINPIINNMLENNKTIEDNNSFATSYQSRIYNRYWRLNYRKHNSNLNSILGLQFIPKFNKLQVKDSKNKKD